MSQILAVTFPLPVLLALGAILPVGLAVGVVAYGLGKPATLRAPARPHTD